MYIVAATTVGGLILLTLTVTLLHSPNNILLAPMRLNLTFAATQSSARKTEFVAFASSTAFQLASTLGQLLATLCNRWKCCPEDLPCVFTLRPSPVSGTLCFWLAEC